MIKVIPLHMAGHGNFVQKRNFFVRLVWYFVEGMILDNRIMPFSTVRIFLLRAFGAQIGESCRMPHAIRVKFPWNLKIGDYCWIGQGVWIYNQDYVTIGTNVCISQECFLTTGSHLMRTTMDLSVAPIVIEDGVWITSRCIVQKGVIIGKSSVVTPLSVVYKTVPENSIFGGNPCVYMGPRL